MAGVLTGVRVVDLSTGIAGPMVGMLLADHGAELVRIDRKDDPYADCLGYHVWQRGKQRVALDLSHDRARILDLIAAADILIENLTPAEATRHQLTPDALAALNKRLIHCSITAYGRGRADSDRADYDALVAARTGLQYEQRGWPEGAINHILGRETPFADCDMPPDWVQGPAREGPLFSASHWPSLGACFLALNGMSAALYVREQTGLGQHVQTSLMQGALAGGSAAWQRAENPDAPIFDTWILGSRSPKGHFQCQDGRWIHNWVPNPRFLLQASASEQLNATPDLTVQNDPDRFGIGPEELLVMAHYQPILADAVRKFSCDDWVAAAAVAKVTVQEVRSVEAALADPSLLADGCVVEVDDPTLGPIRMVGTTYRMGACPMPAPGAVRPAGADTARIDDILAQWQAARPADPQGTALRGAPLAGVRVLDLGLAIAGPFATQQLADLGAEVIKVNTLWDMYWHSTQIAFMANRGKRSIALNLKDPAARDILMALVKTADIVQHNMRYDAAVRLGIDYDSLKKIKPDLIYCHSRGHERGAREKLPGNDQTAACLTGVQYEDGAMAAGGKPLWSLTSFGDTGNGYLAAAGILQALYHRRRTGEGQFVDTAIVNACLLNTSYAVARPDGAGFARPRLDRDHLGIGAANRLYQTRDGWICVVALRAAEWQGLLRLAGADALAAQYPAPAAQYAASSEVGDKIAAVFAALTVKDALAQCAAHGVPAEYSDPEFSRRLFDDDELMQLGWTARYDQAQVGRLDQVGLLYSLSATPGRLGRPPLIVGDQTEAILQELGYGQDVIEELLAARAIGVYPPRAARRTA